MPNEYLSPDPNIKCNTCGKILKTKYRVQDGKKRFCLVCKNKPIEEKFWSLVEVNPGECWGWNGRVDKQFGYGRLGGKAETAARISWKIHFGDIPDGLFVLHKCDNPKCSNPAHLFLGTNDDNLKDAAKKGRMPWGENHWNAKLTNNQVSQIRQRHSNGEKKKDLAKVYGVGRDVISRITIFDAWDHLQS